MQTVKIGWASQTFALSGHNDSRGKKTRNRRTKEERRTMVESFIKKYQSSNNGNFPSLNLTHKEVGGSFYTVREIVRDIIQENRVLGPGSLSLQSLTLDHCSEQQSIESLSLELCGYSLSSTSVHATDEKQKEVLSFSNEHHVMNEEAMAISSEQSDSASFEMVNCKNQETFESHFNEVLAPQFVDGKTAGYQEQILFSERRLNNEQMNEACKETDIFKLSKQGKNDLRDEKNNTVGLSHINGKSAGCKEQILCGKYLSVDQTNGECTEADTIKPLKQGQHDSQDGNFVVKTPPGHSQFVSQTSSSDVSVASDFEIDMQYNNRNMEFSSVKIDAACESAAAAIPDVKLLNTKEVISISDLMQDQSSVCSRKGFSSPSLASWNFDSDKISGDTARFVSSGVIETIVPTNKKEVASVPVYLDSSRNSVDPANDRTFVIYDEKPVAKANLKTITCSDMVDHSTSDVSDVKELPVLTSRDECKENLTSDGKIAFGQESSSVTAELNIKGSLAGSTPSEDGKESSEMMQTNPVMSFFKGLVAAFIKFWAE